MKILSTISLIGLLSIFPPVFGSSKEMNTQHRSDAIIEYVKKNFTAPENPMDIIPYYKPKKPILVSEIKELFGAPDYMGKFRRKNEIVFLLGRKGRIYYYGFFTYKENSIFRYYVFPLNQEIQKLLH